MRPLVLLDVDGVLNALGPASDAWPDWQRGRASAFGRDWPLRWSPTAVAAVASWQDRADVRWLTTWGHAANDGLGALLGLPPLPVAGTPDDPDELPYGPGKAPLADPPGGPGGPGGAGPPGGPGGAGPPGAAAVAEVTPAAPDPLTGRWWKLDVVRRLHAEEPGRPVVWLDDDLADAPDVRAWARAHLDCLLIAPDRREGLVRPHLLAVERFLTRPA